MRALEFLKACGVKELHYLKHNDNVQTVLDDRFPHLEICAAELDDVRKRFPPENS